MKRIVALRNFANTLANGKVIVIVFTLFDVAHRCYVIYTMYVVTTSVSCNILSLWYNIYKIGLYQHLPPRGHPQGVIIVKVYKPTCQSQTDCKMCVHVCHVVFWNVLKRFQNLVLRSKHHFMWISLGISRIELKFFPKRLILLKKNLCRTSLLK